MVRARSPNQLRGCVIYAVTPQFLEAIRGSHKASSYCEAWRNGQRLTYTDHLGATSTRLPIQLAGDSSIDVNGATPGVRRKLTLGLPPTPGLWDLLSPLGTELRPYTTQITSTGTVAVPQGVFPIDVQRLTYGPSGGLSITAPDRWSVIQNARFLVPRASDTSLTIRQQIGRLILETLPAGSSIIDIATTDAPMPAQTWERDRAKAIEDLANAASLDVFFDRDGVPVIRDAPAISDTPVWAVDAGPGGVMVSADRERNRQKTYNIVVVNSTKNDGEPMFPPQVVWDANPDSPTFAGPGAGEGGIGDLPPASAAGPFRQRPTFYSSPLLSNAAQARRAGQTVLQRVLGLAAQLNATAVSNPALDDGDTIAVTFPREKQGQVRATELHIIDSLTVPLVPSKNAQQISTRSTRADDATDS